MPKPAKPVKAFRHKHDKRAYIPSAEDVGYERDNPKVQSEQTNPIVHRGQDLELFWLNKYGASDAERPPAWTSAHSTGTSTSRPRH